MNIEMDYESITEFKLGDKAKILDLPKVVRQRIHEELTELRPEMEKFIEDDTEGNCPGVQSEEWPVTYMYDGEVFIVLISIFKHDFETVDKVFVFNFPKDEIDKLLE